jgi:DNA sulfur modification protein DndD
MILRELVLENFGSYRGRQSISLFPIESKPQKKIKENPSIILFGGMNGGGKTTLIDAIRLALYGHRAQCSTRGNLSYGDFLSQCVYRHATEIELTSIELAFQRTVNNQPFEFRICRTWSKAQKAGRDTLDIQVGQWSEENFVYWSDDALTKTWDERVEEIFPLGISSLFLFDGEQVKELAEQDTLPQIVVDAMRSLLGLELADRLSLDLDVLKTRKRKAIATDKEAFNIEEIEAKIAAKEKEKHLAHHEVASASNAYERAKNAESEAMQKFIAEGGKIAGERAQLETSIRHAEAEVERVRDKLRELAASYLPLVLVSDLLSAANSQAEIEQNQQNIGLTKDVLRDRNDHLRQFLPQLKLSSPQKRKLLDFLDQEESLSEFEINDAAWLNCDLETFMLLQQTISYFLPNQQNSAVVYLNQLQELGDLIDADQRYLMAAAPPEEYRKLSKELDLAKNEATHVQTNLIRAEQHYAKLGNEIEPLKRELLSFSETALTRQNEESMLTSIDKVQQTLKVFRDRLKLRKLNQLESFVTECFLYLLHKTNLIHRVQIDTATFSLSLYDYSGELIPKHRLSAGEKQLLAIALLWGLARASGRQLPIAIDTPLGRLDSSHRANLIERYFPEASHQVILLSTDSEIGQADVKN